MFRDLEQTQNQLMQSQQLIASLEKQYFEQTQQLQSTRNQLQMQIQINMQNLNVMNNLKQTSNENEETKSSMNIIRKQLKKQNKIKRDDVMMNVVNSPRPQSVIIPDDI